MSSTTLQPTRLAQRINNLAAAYDTSSTVEAIEDRITSHSNEYLIPTEDAARLVCEDVLDDLSHNSTAIDTDDILSPTVTQISELSTEGSWPTIVATVTGTISETHDSIAQKVRISDGTGETYVTQFTGTTHPQLEEGQTYTFYNAMPNEYNGSISLVLNEPSLVARSTTDIEAANSYTGIVTDLLSGSGLIKRCSHDDCNRVVTDGACDVHGKNDGQYDLRLKAVLDTGSDAHQVTIGKELTEKLTDFTLESAIAAAKDTMNAGTIAKEMKQQLHGRYITVTGPTVYNSIQADSVTVATSNEDIGITADSIPHLAANTTQGDSE